MFAVDDIDDVVARLRRHRAELVGEVAQYENALPTLLSVSTYSVRIAAPDL